MSASSSIATAARPVPAPARPAPSGTPAGPGAGRAAAGTHEVLRLLADPQRWRILVLLATEQLSTRHLQAELDTTVAVVTRNLRALREAGLVEAARVGRVHYHRLVPGALDDVARLVAMLAEAPGGHVPRRPASD